MNVQGTHFRTIWLEEEQPATIRVIDQRHLPHAFVLEDLITVEQVAAAIKDMHIRGAGLIGATAAWGMYLAVLEAAPLADFSHAVQTSARLLKATRPTAVNLEWAVDLQLEAIGKAVTIEEKIAAAKENAIRITDGDAESCHAIGLHGVALIEQMHKIKSGGTVNILTHCNAGWLAFVDHGSATAPIYGAFDRGIPIHVWVDETRPRNQGASLTAWELLNHGVPHTVISDNAGGHLMQHGMVDMVITGADRVTSIGDAANKIGTYLKALAAQDNRIPFYVALPSSTFDWKVKDGVTGIPIEERGAEEVKWISGLSDGQIRQVLVTPLESPAANYGFDVTPARLITGLITERGICNANPADILRLFPEKKPKTPDEGSIKFRSHWMKAAAPDAAAIGAVNAWRDRLYERGLIGVNSDGIGYGNLSIRLQEKIFLITGSSTGRFNELSPDHYTRVKAYDVEENNLTSEGPIEASSESLTHAMVYECDPGANAVFHVHHTALWKHLLQTLPATAPEVAYGTPAMAHEVARLFRESALTSNRIFAMGGHEDGVIAFGRDEEEAGRTILEQFNQLQGHSAEKQSAA